MAGLVLLWLAVAVGWFGGMTLVGQATLAIGALLLGVGAGVFARPSLQAPAVSTLLRRLGFLAGALVVWCLLQILNPGMRFIQSGETWWMEKCAALSWLPQGVQAPWEMGNGARSLLHFAAGGALLAIGLQHFRSHAIGVLLSKAISLGAACFALVGILGTVAGTGKVLGLWEVDFDYSFGPIVYKNHAVALLVLACGWSATEWRRALSAREERESGWSFMAGLCFVVVCLALLATRSAFGTVFAVVFLALVVKDARRFLRQSRFQRWLFISFAAALAAWAVVSQGPRLQQKVAEWREGEGTHSVSSRVTAIQAGLEMWKDRPWYGWGIGAFQYGFTKYKREIPLLDRSRQLQLHWLNLHSDWVEILIELGLVGIAPLVVLLALIARTVGGPWHWRKCGAEYLGASLVLVFGYAWIDFPFRNPAVLYLLAVTLAWHIRLCLGLEAQESNSVTCRLEPGPSGATSSRI